jgi:hypothetical protein
MAKIVQIAGKPVHAMHDHRVAIAHEGQQRVELRPLRVLSRCLLSERPVKVDSGELAHYVLLKVLTRT